MYSLVNKKGKYKLYLPFYLMSTDDQLIIFSYAMDDLDHALLVHLSEVHYRNPRQVLYLHEQLHSLVPLRAV